MTRPGQPAGVFQGYGADPPSILGSLLVEYWESDLGIALASGAVDTWTGQKLGKVLSAPGAANRPSYGADGSNFHSKSVVGLVGGVTPLELIGSSLALTAGGTRPSFVLVCRMSVTHSLANAYPLVLDDGAGTGQLLYIVKPGDVPGNAYVAFTGASAVVRTPFDGASHADECSSSTVPVGSFFRDGASVGTPSAPAVEAAVDRVYMGHQFEGLTDGTFVVAGLYVLSAQMSAAQRSAFRVYCQGRWGTP
jgi:hypothetical protein